MLFVCYNASESFLLKLRFGGSRLGDNGIDGKPCFLCLAGFLFSKSTRFLRRVHEMVATVKSFAIGQGATAIVGHFAGFASCHFRVRFGGRGQS